MILIERFLYCLIGVRMHYREYNYMFFDLISMKCGDFAGGLLWIISPPFIKYKWNIMISDDIIESEI